MNSQRQKSEWWLPGAGGGRNEELVNEPPFGKETPEDGWWVKITHQ